MYRRHLCTIKTIAIKRTKILLAKIYIVKYAQYFYFISTSYARCSCRLNATLAFQYCLETRGLQPANAGIIVHAWIAVIIAVLLLNL